ncbi:SDR family oxidoreductase [bacterium]|jgi:UDP-glucose 4-epimerase|nr:SDR family oxidoreductase [bacterium]
MKKCLVTGGAGFIGSHIAAELVSRDCEVTVLDNLSTGKLENMESFKDEVDFVQGSITDLDLLNECFQGIDTIFHQAALASVPRSVDDPVTSNDHNVNGTLNVLVAARDAGVGRVVYAASSSAYGDSDVLPKVETMPSKPMSPYAVNKYVGELYLKVFNDIYGLSAIGLRYFNVFGERQDPQSQYAAVLPLFITQLLAGDTPTINGDGSFSRDFTYVGNVVHANILAAQIDNPDGAIVNIACGDRISLSQLYESISSLLSVDKEPNYAETRIGDVPHSQADISMAKQLLGYEPVTSFQIGLEKTVNWYKADSNN